MPEKMEGDKSFIAFMYFHRYSESLQWILFYFSMNGCVVVSMDGSNSLSNNKKAEMATLAQSQSKQSLLDLRQQSEDSLFVITL